MLNAQQQVAAEGLRQFVEAKEYIFALLLGPAGSGKTFTVANVIKQLDLSKRPFLVACPTHKAKRVLVNALQRHGIDNVEATTVAALIGKAPSASDDPDEEGKAQWMVGGGSVIKPNALLILDEISMIDFNDMKSIKKAVESASAQAILTGDFSQLRPVRGRSIAEAVEKIPLRYSLSEVMRSEAGNIVGMSKAVRTTGELDLGCVDGSSVIIHNNNDLFEQSFLNEKEGVAIAYTNRRVSELNRAKRQHIYGPTVRDFMPNEEVILTESPLFIEMPNALSKFNKIKVADNNDQLNVISCSPLKTTQTPLLGEDIHYYNIYLHNPETGLDFETKGLTFDMYMSNFKPAMDSLLTELRGLSGRLGKLDEALERRAARQGLDKKSWLKVTDTDLMKFFPETEAKLLMGLAATNPKFLSESFGDENFFDGGPEEARRKFTPVKGNWKTLRKLIWARDYFGFRGQFAVLLYSHASTAHKAQGSTYKHVFIDWPNLMTIRDTDDRQAACYVAVSRASDSLHIRV
jgi:hypothetical protein